MFEKITPEKAGISSVYVKKFIEKLEYYGLCSHGLVLMRDDKIFSEHYWAPFNKDSLNRMYSQTKSFVGIGIGILEAEGKLSLSDKISTHFPEKIERDLPPYLKDLTIEEMLTMQTTGNSGHKGYWFHDGDIAYDRTSLYFNYVDARRPGGTIWEYDSPGTQVLSSLIEKISGMSLLEFLKEKMFNKLGTFKPAEILKCKNDDSWGDSAMLCTVRDICSFAWLLKEKGIYNGEELVPSDYVKKATTPQADNNETGFESNPFSYGYGYKIWCTKNGGFAFVGMGQQLTVCYPEKNLIFSYTSDNQGYLSSRSVVMNLLDCFILDNLSDESLPENKEAYDDYINSTDNLKLYALKGATTSPLIEKINNVRFVCSENECGFKEFHFEFKDETKGEFHYENEQGKKVIYFGIGENAFAPFPQLGYSTLHGGTVSTDGSMYDSASSLIFTTERNIGLKVQIIDKYLGNLYMRFGFKDDEAVIKLSKTAEAFLDEYEGYVVAKKA